MVHKLLPHWVSPHLQLILQKQSVQTKVFLRMNISIMASVITPVLQSSAAGRQDANRALSSSSTTVINEEGWSSLGCMYPHTPAQQSVIVLFQLNKVSVRPKRITFLRGFIILILKKTQHGFMKKILKCYEFCKNAAYYVPYF